MKAANEKTAMALCTLALLSLVPARPACALDLAAPANIRVAVKDAAGQPVEGATVRLVGPSDQEMARATSDATGAAALQNTGNGNISWTARVFVEKAGMAAQGRPLKLFPGAQMEESFAIEPALATRIKVLGPDGLPLAGIAVSFEFNAGGGKRVLAGGGFQYGDDAVAD